MSSNKELTNYLDFYISDSKPKNFAILLDGPWGAGKTYFINKFREQKTNGPKFLYVSLYGLAKTSEIDEQIFKLLHPFLASKPVSVLTKIVKSSLRVGFKVSLDTAGNESTVDLSVPDVELTDFFNSAKDAILIFDDLERCSIAIDKALGYINYFCEHQGHRVIIIANEKEILKDDATRNEKYLKIKEKLIGRTFYVKADVEQAFKHFLASVDNIQAKTALLDNVDLILGTYRHSKYNNLRSLNQAVIEWPRLFATFPEKAKKHKDFISDVLQALLILSFELRCGEIKTEQLKGISKHAYKHSLKNEKDAVNPISEIEKKYGSFLFENLCPTDYCWYEFFKDGAMSQEFLENSVDKSKYFRGESTEDWVKLWYFTALEDSEFQKLLNQVRTNFDNSKYKKPGVIKHIAGLYLHFAKENIISDRPSAILKWIIKKIKEMGKADQLEYEKIDRFDWSDAYSNLGFMDLKSTEFKQISDLLKQLTEKAEKRSYPKIAEKLLKLVKQDSRKFWESLSYRFQNGQNFNSIPILTYINPKDFLEAYLESPNSNKDNIAYALKDRYSIVGPNNKLVAELDWLKSLKKTMLANASNSSGLVKYILRGFCEHTLDDAISRLSEIAKNEKNNNPV